MVSDMVGSIFFCDRLCNSAIFLTPCVVCSKRNANRGETGERGRFQASAGLPQCTRTATFLGGKCTFCISIFRVCVL
jgi:hypothetical protein